ncbi:MAG: metallophosphoesterase [Opitutaceae bacterium]|nr:metallophosphoesterase [Opitutaceae bacterium]
MYAVFAAVLASVVALLQIYVFWRAASVPAISRRLPSAWLWLIGAALWGLFLVGRLYGHGRQGALAAALESAGMWWLVVLFLAAVCLLLVETLTGFGWLFPRATPRLRGAALAAGLGLSAVAFVQGHRPPVVEEYSVPIAGLSREYDGMVVVALSDLHLTSAADAAWLADRVRQAMAERPDLIVLLGDIVEGHGEVDGELASILRGLSAPFGVWGVLGNHESYGPGDGNIAFLHEAGIRVLLNSWEEVRPGLILAGVNDLSRDQHTIADLTATLHGRPPGVTVLLSHAPVGADFAATQGVSLMLCGHTHGGQIWPFSHLVRLYYPLLKGRFTIGDTTVLVGRGTGTWGPRMRLWERGAILRVILRQA